MPLSLQGLPDRDQFGSASLLSHEQEGCTLRIIKSHGLGLAGAIVAATADAEGADLKTLNVKHYPMFKGLKPAYRKTSHDQPSVSSDA